MAVADSCFKAPEIFRTTLFIKKKPQLTNQKTDCKSENKYLFLITHSRLTSAVGQAYTFRQRRRKMMEFIF
jgi:hypothetical protein